MDETKYQLMARLCIEKYQSLSKTGKPLDNQWTTLCGLICEQSDSFKVVCLTTGTKCVTGCPSKLTNVLIDCHAEVLCKRAFKQHLMGLIETRHHHGDYLNHLDNLNWHLFISQLPCGTIDRYQGPSKQGINQGISRKPGRGEPCLDSSCIDKILKWTLLGFQGKRLIALTRKPIYLKSLIIGNCVETKEFDREKVEQSLTITFDQQKETLIDPIFSSDLVNKRPEIYFLKTIKCSPFVRYNHLQACPSAIVCWDENGDKCEIVVEGLKQGVNKSRAASNPLRISREGLEKRFEQLIEKVCDQNHQSVVSYTKHWRHLQTIPRFVGWKIEANY